MRDAWWIAVDVLAQAREACERWLFGQRHALTALALCRILLGSAVFLTLAVNFSERSLWVGNGSIWAEPARDATAFPELWLVRNATDGVVTVVYAVTVFFSLALVFGWYTKVANAMTFVGFVAIAGQNPMIGASSDNAVRLALLWLLLTACGERCSLDSRRKELKIAMAGGGQRVRDAYEALPKWLGVSLHNIGVLGLAVQTVLLYTTAGFDKIARSAWRSGEALYYTTQLPEFRPFPAISDAVSSSSVVLALLTYAVLLTQLFFAPLMLTRPSRVIAVTVALIVNIFFAVVFGSVTASLAIMAVTFVVFPDDLLEERIDWLAEIMEPVVAWWDDVWFKITEPWYDFTDRFRRG
ncbi:MAG: HTTM domain-containing protein [Aeromicrobium sp.]|uniref:HTTM domain-containing protein n=1 Tax=Aeromicrobium sp. TaxID=1871063 RepID=UPI0039E6B187